MQAEVADADRHDTQRHIRASLTLKRTNVSNDGVGSNASDSEWYLRIC
jgi:hypothetical protein